MNEVVAFWPPPLVYEYVSWRERLRAAINRSGMKHSVVALDAGITPETLSRILTAEHQRPSLDTITRIAHAVNENVGWILEEQGFSLSAEEAKELRTVVRFLDTALLHSPQPRTIVRAEPNVLAVVTRRRAIPPMFAKAGAKLVYQATDDSLRDVGIVDGDLLFVRPAPNFRDLDGQLIVAEVAGQPVAKILELKGDRISLLSRNDRYASRLVFENELETIGVVVGRMGGVCR